MKQALLSAIDKIPLAPAIALFAKTVWDARFREAAPPLTDPLLVRWHEAMMRDGVTAVETFLDRSSCETLRAEVESLMARCPAVIQHDPEGADARIFLGAVPPGRLAEIYAEPRLALLAAASLGGGVINLATLAGRITAVAGNRGSGGGWHRDSFTNQFKTILYLNDVDADGGPFQYVAGSHRLGAMIRDARTAALRFGQSRIEDAQIARLLAAEPARLRTLTGAAGTLIIADTTGIHRGMPIRAGTRTALTNYYYPRRLVTQTTTDHFKPVLGHHIPY